MSHAIDGALTPWIGAGYRHINATRGDSVLDFTHAGEYGKNRWNVPGEPTLYLAGDMGVAIAEWGRRYPVSFTSESIPSANRDVYRLHLRLSAVLDLRSPESLSMLGISGTPDVFRDVDIARATAAVTRLVPRAQAMLVPSIAFLDDLTRWNLVVFLEKMPSGTDAWITRVDHVGPLSWHPNV